MRERRQVAGASLVIAALLLGGAAPPASAQDDDSVFLQRYAVSAAAISHAQQVTVVFSEEDHFEYHYTQFDTLPFGLIDDRQGLTSFVSCVRGGDCAQVFIPTFVCDIRMALERAKRYFDQYADTHVTLHGRIPVDFGYGFADKTQPDGNTVSNGYGDTRSITLRSGYERPSLGLATAIHEYFHVVQNARGWPRQRTLREGTAEWATDQPIPLAVRGTTWLVRPATADMLNEYANDQRNLPDPHDLFLTEPDTNAYLSSYFWKYYAEQIADAIGPGELGAILDLGARAGQEDLANAIGRPFNPADPLAGFQQIFGRYVTTMAAPRWRPDSPAKAWMGIRDTALGPGANADPRENAVVRTPPPAGQFMNKPTKPHYSSPDGSHPYQRERTLPQRAMTDDERVQRFREQRRFWSWGAAVPFGAYLFVSLPPPRAIRKPTTLWICVDSADGYGDDHLWLGGVVKRRPDGAHAGVPQPIRTSPTGKNLVVVQDFGGLGGPEDVPEVLVGLGNASRSRASGTAQLGFIVTPIFELHDCGDDQWRSVCVPWSSSGNRTVFTDGDQLEVRMKLSSRVHVSAHDQPSAEQTTLRLEAVEADDPSRSPTLVLKGPAGSDAPAVRVNDAEAFIYTLRFGLADQPHMPEGAYRVRLTAESLLRLGYRGEGEMDETIDTSLRILYRPPPPYVTRVEAAQAGAVRYAGSWDTSAPTGRLLNVEQRSVIPTKPDSPPVEITVSFSRDLDLPPRASIGNVAVPLHRGRDWRTWTGQFTPAALGLPESGPGAELPVAIRAHEDHKPLDADPRTIPVPKDDVTVLRADARAWRNYESIFDGGPLWTDVNHLLLFGHEPPRPPPPATPAGACHYGEERSVCAGDVVVRYHCSVSPEEQKRLNEPGVFASLSDDGTAWLEEVGERETPQGRQAITKPIPLSWQEDRRDPCPYAERCVEAPYERLYPDWVENTCEGQGPACRQKIEATCRPVCSEICGYWRPLLDEQGAARAKSFYAPCWDDGDRTVLCTCGPKGCEKTSLHERHFGDQLSLEERMRSHFLLHRHCWDTGGEGFEWIGECDGGPPTSTGSR